MYVCECVVVVVVVVCICLCVSSCVCVLVVVVVVCLCLCGVWCVCEVHVEVRERDSPHSPWGSRSSDYMAMRRQTVSGMRLDAMASSLVNVTS